MNILVSTNAAFLKPLIVALSTLVNNTNEQILNVYFLNINLSTKQIEWLNKQISRHQKICLTIIDISEYMSCD